MTRTNDVDEGVPMGSDWNRKFMFGSPADCTLRSPFPLTVMECSVPEEDAVRKDATCIHVSLGLGVTGLHRQANFDVL
jgi:hypothetical protein